MDPLTMGIIGGLLGLGKGAGGNAQSSNAMKANAELTRYSPWNKVDQLAVNKPNMLGDILSSALTGVLMGKAIGPGGITELPKYNLGSVGSGAGGIGGLTAEGNLVGGLDLGMNKTPWSSIGGLNG